MEELLQIILQWSPCQQQLMIYLVAIEDPEKLENGAKKGKRKGPSVASHWPILSTFSCLQLPFPSGSEAPNPSFLPLPTWTSSPELPRHPASQTIKSLELFKNEGK